MNLLMTTGFLVLLTVAVVQSSSLFEDELIERCEVRYEKVGCYNDRGESSRALTDLVFNDRKNIQWAAGAWEQYLMRLACRCARESSAKGYSHFGLQFYGECFSGPQAAERFDLYGESDKCVGYGYKECSDGMEQCVGGRNLNYVYRIVGDEGGSGSGILLEEP